MTTLTPEDPFAAFVERKITPPVGCPLTGFIARTSLSTDVHDDLFAKMWVVESGGLRFALIMVDMLGTDIPTATRLRQRVAEVLDTSVESVMLNATHTHAGPASIELLGIASVNTEFLRTLDETLRLLAEEAMTALEPASFSHLRGQAQGVGVVRRWEGQGLAGYSTDTTLDILRIERPHGTPMGMIISMPCHAVAAGWTTSISADFPGVMVRALQPEFPDQVIAFAQGCCGDINPAAGVKDHSAADQTGRMLADAVRRVLRTTTARTFDGPIRSLQTTARLPLSALPSEKDLLVLQDRSLRSDSTAIDRAMGEYARRTLAALRDGTIPADIEVPVQAIVIDTSPSLRILGLPGEPFSPLAVGLRSRVSEPLMILGYTNGLMGYVAHRAAYEEPGYELAESHRYYGQPAGFAPEAGERLMEAALSVCR